MDREESQRSENDVDVFFNGLETLYRSVCEKQFTKQIDSSSFSEFFKLHHM